MSFEDHPFRWVPSLQHMAKVKIIEILWRNCNAGRIISSGFQIYSSIMIQRVQTKVDVLRIPQKMKIDMKFLCSKMVDKAIGWLYRTSMDNPDLHESDEGRTEALRYFTDNLCFNSFGYVDAKKTIESHVKDKESVGYWVWHELCLYCIEDKIVEFSKKFNWQDCSNCLNSQLSVYWYRKIHGEVPSNKMLTSNGNLQRNKGRQVGAFSNRNIVRSMLEASTANYRESRSVAAIIYFQNQLNNEEEFSRLVPHSITQVYVGGILIYLLRARPKDAWIDLVDKYADFLLIKLTT